MASERPPLRVADLPLSLTVAEAAAVLRVSKATAYEPVHRWIATEGRDGLRPLGSAAASGSHEQPCSASSTSVWMTATPPPDDSGLLLTSASGPRRRRLAPVPWMVLEQLPLRSFDEDGQLVAPTSARHVASELGLDPGTVARALRPPARPTSSIWSARQDRPHLSTERPLKPFPGETPIP